ncbi:MAG: Cof-type HAD-IIB family hydrolase [Clostridium sp.]
MDIKLICTDMDGTLLNSNHLVSTENKETLKKAINHGIIVSIATGRLFTSANYYRNLIGIDAPLICANGAYIKDKKTEKILYKNALSLDESLELYNISKKYDLHLFFNTWNTAISTKEFIKNHAYAISNEGMSLEDRTNFVVNEDLTSTLKEYEDEILKLICIDYSNEKKSEIIKARKEIEALDKYEVVCSGPFNFEVMKKGTTKGLAVKKLAELLNIKPENVMCLGDSENDLSMLQYAGIPIAMENGLDIVKENALYITDTNNNSGVSKAIKHFVKNL